MDTMTPCGATQHGEVLDRLCRVALSSPRCGAGLVYPATGTGPRSESRGPSAGSRRGTGHDLRKGHDHDAFGPFTRAFLFAAVAVGRGQLGATEMVGLTRIRRWV